MSRTRCRWPLLAGRGSRSIAILVVGAAVLVDGRPVRDAFAVTGATQNTANGHWYLYVGSSTHVAWNTCKAAAEALGGYLATITSAAENQWISSNLMSGRPKTYLGGSDAVTEGTWLWVTSEAWSYSNWNSGEPNNSGGYQHYLQWGGQYGANWDDAGDGNTHDTDVYGYIVEWDTDPNGPPPPPPPPPQAPMNLVATYVAGGAVSLSWTDTSTDETGFRVERKPAGYSFSLLATTSADSASHMDGLLYPSTTFVYRVASFNAGGSSAYSNEVSITTSDAVPIPVPPRAPDQLTAARSDDGSIRLTWTDNSVDELLFGMERTDGGGSSRSLVNLKSDVAEFEDRALHPGWPYAYRVRALSLQGPSPWSNTAGATLPATLDVTVTSGSLADSKKRSADKLKLVGAYSFPATDPAAATLDPVAHGLELQLGAANAPIVVSIAPADAAWKVKSRKGQPIRAAWRSAKGRSPRVAVVVDLVRHVLTATVSGADFTAAPTSLVRLLVASGADGGAHAADWTERKPGVLRFE